MRGGRDRGPRRVVSLRRLLPLGLALLAAPAFGQGSVSELLLFRAGTSVRAELGARDLLDDRTTDATQTLADGSVLTIECQTSQEWRDDGYAISNAFQIVRGLQYLRKELERSFWLPFLGL